MRGYGAMEACASNTMESAARQLLQTKIDDQRKSHDRRMRRLGRLRSVSVAFVEAQEIGHRTVLDGLYATLMSTD